MEKVAMLAETATHTLPRVPCVLVVVDETKYRPILTDLLNQMALKMLVPHPASQANQQAASEHPDLVILDLELPEDAGIKIFKQLKNDSRTREIPVLNLTTSTTSAALDLVLEADGLVDVLGMPVVGRILEAHIRKLLHQHRALKSLKRERDELDERVEHGTREIAALNAQIQRQSAEHHRNLEVLHSKDEHLRQVQKLEAVGILAGGVAHEFNNLLMVILGNLELVLRAPLPGESAKKNIKAARIAADRAAILTNQLLTFSRRQFITPRVLALDEIVLNATNFMESVLGENIKLTVAVNAVQGWAKLDDVQFEQALLNLAINARDAMPQGGRLYIETACVDLDEAYTRTHASVLSGAYIMVSVSDTGTGMDAATCARIFEPFFTTKKRGKGTGLGLATVYGIVKQSGGNIWVYSELGKGTTFKIYIPRVNDPPEKPRRSSPKLPATGTETLLVVEDEAGVRTIIQEMLVALGYTVLTAADGEEALAIHTQHTGKLHLLITDIVMPNLNGAELANRLCEARPGLKVLFMSGFAQQGLSDRGLMNSGMEFLAKPFNVFGLSTKVREALDKA